MTVPDARPASLAGDLERVFRQESGRAVATLVRLLRDVDLAEEAVQEAFTVAASAWAAGLPPNPGGWITTTAKNRAIDRLRRERSRDDRHAQAALLHAHDPAEPTGPVRDDRLRLIFTCCHPALAPTAQVALTLRLLCGLAPDEIARAFLIPETTLAQRLTRAKRKIKAAGIPYRVPEPDELPRRLPPVLAVIYLTYTEGHSATSGGDLLRADLCAEAVRLARLLVELLPDEPEALGLLALLLLVDARRATRTGQDGTPVLLADQDRGRWDGELIAQGQQLVRRCLRRGRPGPYQLQAAINAVHSDAARAADTDWGQILALYDQLIAITPTPVVALNRAVALAEVAGPHTALALVEELEPSLSHYRPFHVTRAELLARVGRSQEATAGYRRAIELSANAAERELLQARLRAAPDRPAPDDGPDGEASAAGQD